MRLRIAIIALAALSSAAGGCATPPPGFLPLRDPNRRFVFDGFSVQPPTGGNWYEMVLNPGLAVPKVTFLRKLSGSHTAMVSVQVYFTELERPTAEDLKKLHVTLYSTTNSPRLKLLEDKVWSESDAPARLRFETLTEDRGVPGTGGAVFHTSNRGVFLSHPGLPGLLIEAFYSERSIQGDKPLRLDAETRRFFESLRLETLTLPMAVACPGGGNALCSWNGCWVTNWSDHALHRLDRDTGLPVASIKVGRNPIGVTAFEDAIWVSSKAEGTVSRIDPVRNEVVARIPVGRGPRLPAAGAGSVWVPNSESNSVSRIDAKTNQIISTIAVPGEPSSVAFDGTAVWVVSIATSSLSRIDPQSNSVGNAIKLDEGAARIAFGEGSLWVTCPNSSSVMRIDPKTAAVLARISMDGGPTGVDVGMGRVWVSALKTGLVYRVDPRTNQVSGDPIRVGKGPAAIAVDSKSVWVANTEDGTVSRIVGSP
jgi:YVTN family beta-propeller protein